MSSRLSCPGHTSHGFPARRTQQLCSLYLTLLLTPAALPLTSAARSQRLAYFSTEYRLVDSVGHAAKEATNKLHPQAIPDCSNAYVAIDSNVGPVKYQQIAASIQGLTTGTQHLPLVTIDSILQNQPTYGLHRQDKCPDAQVNGQNSFSVRMEPGMTHQSAQQEMRKYFISFTARNDAGSCSGVATNCMPEGKACITPPSAALYDSTSCSLYPFRRANSLNWSELQQGTEFAT